MLDDNQAVPLGNEPVYGGDHIIGKTASAAFGHRAGKPVVLAYLDCREHDLSDGLRVAVDPAGTLYSGSVKLAAVFDPKGTRRRARSF